MIFFEGIELKREMWIKLGHGLFILSFKSGTFAKKVINIWLRRIKYIFV
jgi:hypothetical protein